MMETYTLSYGKVPLEASYYPPVSSFKKGFRRAIGRHSLSFKKTKPVYVEEERTTEFYSSMKTEILFTLDKIKILLREVLKGFNDFTTRQVRFVQVKHAVDDLVQSLLGEDSYLTQTLTLLSDGLKYLRAEGLSEQQLDALLGVIDICKKIDLEREDARECGSSLRKYKISTLPSIG